MGSSRTSFSGGLSFKSPTVNASKKWFHKYINQVTVWYSKVMGTNDGHYLDISFNYTEIPDRF